MKIALVQPQTEEEFAVYYDLRYRILREPWRQPRGSERDETDAQAYHLLALDRSGGVPVAAGVGCLVLTSPGEARIRFMAVEPVYHGRGVGRLLIEQLENEARRLGRTRIYLLARENALGFYLKMGYSNQGPSNLLFGCIQHYLMTKQISL